MKGNGKPLFVLANAVDDRTMAITHVIRGEDLLPTTPRQIMLWGALNAAEGADLALPAYAHLPLLVNEQGKKLSKRRDPVAVEMYREQGYLPDAFRNYLALLGWSPGDEEILPIETIIERFRLEDVQHSPAFFDVKKLTHMNGVYIRELPTAGLHRRARGPGSTRRRERGRRGLARSGHRGTGQRTADLGARSASTPRPSPRLAPLIQERVAVLGEVPELVDFLFLAGAPDDPDSWQKAVAGDDEARPHPGRRPGRLRRLRVGRRRLHAATLTIAERVGRKLGKAQAPIRVAVMGRTRGLPALRLPGGARPGRDATPPGRRPRSAGRRPLMLLAPIRWALRIAGLVLAVIVLYFGVTLVQVWLTSRQYDPHPAGAILVMGAAQYDGVPSPDLAGPARRGAAPLPPGLRAPDRGHGEQEAGRRLHRGAVRRACTW